MPFGVARIAYSAPCQAYADGERDNRIIWYFVPDTRDFYEGQHVFSPRVDDMFQPSGSEYELTGRIPNPRQYYSGRDVWLFPGLAVDGDAEDFEGRAPRAKYIHGDQYPPHPCNTAKRVLHLLHLGHVTIKEPPKLRLLEHGLLIGNAVMLDGDGGAYAPLALYLGERGRKVGDAGIAFRLGMLLGEVAEIPPHVPGIYKHGLEVADPVRAGHGGGVAGALEIGYTIVGKPHHGAAFGEGLLLGFIANVEPQEPPALNEGLEIAFVASMPLPPAPRYLEGLEIGNVVIRKPPSDPGIYPFGLEIGLNVTAEELDGPGTSCGNAPFVAYNDDIFNAVPLGQSHYWKLTTGDFSTYHLTLHLVEGEIGSVWIKRGPNCETLTDLAVLSFDDECESFDTEEGNFILVEVNAGLMDGFSYWLEWGSGVCP